MNATEKIWMNGELVDWGEAKVHVGAHSLHHGSGVFEGIRCYETPGGPVIFRLRDHLQRLHDSARILHMEIPYAVDELAQATRDLVRRNGLSSCYIRPLAFHGYGGLGVAPTGTQVDTAILSFPWGAYLGESQENGITAAISSLRRVGASVVPHAAKATGVYLNSMLATMEARRAGYEEAILLTEAGASAGCPGENVFVVKDGVVLCRPS